MLPRTPLADLKVKSPQHPQRGLALWRNLYQYMFCLYIYSLCWVFFYLLLNKVDSFEEEDHRNADWLDLYSNYSWLS